jgi:hypothetical protein
LEASVPREIVVKGNYTQQQIKLQVDKTLRLYRVPITEDNYAHIGDVLVVLRKEFGCREMEVLTYMQQLRVEGVKDTLENAAALSCFTVKNDR